VVVDTSALLAILLQEPEATVFSKAIAEDSRRFVSALSMLEAAIVIESKKGEAGGRELDLLTHRAALDIVPLTSSLYEIARDAWRRYGKGRHPAGLNLGDCCAYALSRLSGEPLLFKGGDFARTDATPAAPGTPA
jgi:ribonuclease VapC